MVNQTVTGIGGLHDVEGKAFGDVEYVIHLEDDHVVGGTVWKHSRTIVGMVQPGAVGRETFLRLTDDRWLKIRIEKGQTGELRRYGGIVRAPGWTW